MRRLQSANTFLLICITYLEAAFMKKPISTDLYLVAN